MSAALSPPLYDAGFSLHLHPLETATSTFAFQHGRTARQTNEQQMTLNIFAKGVMCNCRLQRLAEDLMRTPRKSQQRIVHQAS